MPKELPDPASMKTVTVSMSVSTPIVGASPNRRTLSFMGVYSPDGVVINNRPIAALGDGIPLTEFLPPILLTRATHGSIVGDAWYGWGAAADVLVPIVETFDHEPLPRPVPPVS